MGGGKGGGGAKISQYHMSLHAGLCVGPVDEINTILFADKTIYQGSITQSMVFNVNLPELFGGDEREGGCVGGITVLMGEDHQILPAALKAKTGSISTLIPSYRNMTSLFFHQPVLEAWNGALLADIQDFSSAALFGSARAGFYFQANNPYLKKLRVITNRQAKGLDRRHATIWRDAAQTVADTNPAHVIYELQVNRDFGAGLPISKIDVESYELAARTLYNEGFGVSLKWVQQGKVKDLILEMLDHINAVCYEDPRTGLSKLKLLRGDYDVNDVPLATPDNSRVSDFQRKHEELVNEIVVTYTDGQSYEEASVTVQDLAGIATEGGVISTGRNYYAVHKPALAKQLGERDLRAEGYPLATAEVEFFREFWDLSPGDIIKLNSPEDNDNTLVMRVLKLEDDTDRRSYVKGTLIEDVFALEAAPFLDAPETLFEDPTAAAEAADEIKAITLPYIFSTQSGLSDSSDDDYPIVFLGALAASDQAGADSYNIAAEVTGALGNTSFENVATCTIMPRGFLTQALPGEVETVTPLFTGLSNGEVPEPESILLIGGLGEGQDELAGVTTTDGSTYTLRRGILDTTPKEWPSGTPVWVMDDNAVFWDATQRAAFEDAEFKILPITPVGTFPESSAALQSYTLTERPYLPFRPANVIVGGVAFGTLDLTVQDDVDVTWKTRQRQYEDAVILAWDADSVPIETGQTVEIDITNTAGAVFASHTGITGESFTIPSVSFQGLSLAVVKVYSSRDGYRSLQAHEILVSLPGGYGNDYGQNYGE